MGAREILTLQFGHYSNYIGTHWWNIQETGFEYGSNSTSEINHDVLFREGLTPKGQCTFTPRLLLVDLKNSLKTLPEQGDLYEPISKPSKSDVQWDENRIEIKKQEQVEKNKFLQDIETPEGSSKEAQYDLANNINVWSDYLYTKFHPRTVNILNDYEHGNVNSSFNIFPTGRKLWNTEQFQEDFSDKIRNYVEECDSFQGFHILLDSINGFSGLSTACIESLRDEYDRKAVFAFPVIPSYFKDHDYKTDEEKQWCISNDSVRVLNTALTYASLAEHSSLFVPLCTGCTGWRQPGPKREFNHTSYDPSLPYHTSAILASALDTFSLKYRLKTENYHLTDLSTDLTPNGRKAVCASICLPFSLKKDAYLIDCLDDWEGPLTQSITPNCSIGNERLLQLFTLRGVNENRLKKPLKAAGKQREMAAYRCETIKEMLSLYLSCNYYASASDVTIVSKALSTKVPFPNIFDYNVGVNGNIYPESRPFNVGVESMPVMTGLHSGSGIGNMLESLHVESKRIRLKKLHQFSNEDLEQDEMEEALTKLFDLRECYEDNYLL